jgi:hypothetical protein
MGETVTNLILFVTDLFLLFRAPLVYNVYRNYKEAVI